MRVLVTGGAGFIGVNLVRRLVELGVDVDVLDDLSTGLRSNLDGLAVRVVEGSLIDPETVRAAVDGADTVVHLGARGSVPRSIRNPRATHDVNATGTLNVLEACRRTGSSVVYSSSSSVYGANAELPKREDMWTAPLTPYAASKLSAEGYVQAYGQAYGLSTLCFRFFNVFGPWQRPDHDYAAVIPKWIWTALAGGRIVVNGDGSVTRDFTYVDDVVDVLVHAVAQQVSHPGPVNLAFGRPVSLLDVLDEMRRTIGEVEVTFGPARPGDIQHSENDPALLHQIVPGLAPRPFAEAFAATVDWLRTSGEMVTGGPAVVD